MKKRIFNKLGMTYVELLCALSLLTLIVVSFTPMFLSSYENLYKAGERVEKVYNSQVEMEKGLAIRNSQNDSTVLLNMSMNGQTALEKLKVSGRKIVSTLQENLETVFHGARTRIDIISPNVVYDDSVYHDVVLQTTGLKYDSADDIVFSFDPKNYNAMVQNKVYIVVYVPDKTASGSEGTTTHDAVYGPIKASVTLNNVDVKNNRISFTVSGADFTQSPLQIRAYYRNDRNILKTLTTYLYIEPASIVFAGDTTHFDYYTTAGVQETKDSAGNTIYELKAEGRKMRLDNSGYLSPTADSPNARGTIFKTVTWVGNDNNSYISPYYVLAGTNSSVYRMYNYKKVDSSLVNVFSLKNQNPAETTDNGYILENGTYVYPSFWSGEMSDQYYFKTLEHSSGYGAAEYVGSDCTQAQGDNNGYDRDHTGSRYDYFDKTLRYMMQFNGFTTGYDYQHLANRRISYVLTEVGGGYDFRLGGKLRESSQFSSYSLPWEPEYYIGGGNKVAWKKVLGIAVENRIIAGTSKDNPYVGVVYFQGSGSGGQNKHFDRNLAYIRIKSSVSVDPIAATMANNSDYIDRFNKGDFWWPEGYKESDEEKKNIIDQYPNNYDWISTNHANSVNVTASVYLPGSGSKGQGQVIYFGTVPAYAFLEQSSDIGSDEDAIYVYNGKNIKDSRATGYVVLGTQGNGATIYRNHDPNSNDIETVSNTFRGLCLGTVSNLQYRNVATNEGEANTFFTYSANNTTQYYNDTDLEFTFGYCSRWRMAVGDVTSNGVTETTRSYEKYYTQSHYEGYYDRKPGGGINTGDSNNLYYNMWFPGEYYNLTNVATCDEVTVAVGYTVSGSVFTKESSVISGYYGTALGSIYNDAVLAAYTSTGQKYSEGLEGKGEQNIIFKNLLYYKDGAFKNSYLHSRASVRFTAVGINSETDSSGNKKYYAYYGDSRGYLYKSLVATATVKASSGTEDICGQYCSPGHCGCSNTSHKCDDCGVCNCPVLSKGVESTTLVNYIADLGTNNQGTTNPSAPSKMEEVKVGGSVSLSTYFSEIVSIVAEEDIVIVTGKMKSTAGNFERIVIGTKSAEGVWTWKCVINGQFTGLIRDAKVIGSYYYIVGDDGAGNGWIAAVSTDTLKNLANGATIKTTSFTSPTPGKSSEEDCLIWVPAQGNMYALDGRVTS